MGIVGLTVSAALWLGDVPTVQFFRTRQGSSKQIEDLRHVDVRAHWAACRSVSVQTDLHVRSAAYGSIAYRPAQVDIKASVW